ncbi:GldG family protein [Treponema primitia]|uniref:GldG family protein n=1 Tax=Treponema primitia TaxID=88058 RepID=UPI00025556C9|nr:Gldg family protein [Treponema primitia]
MTKRQVTIITVLSIAAMFLVILISQRLWFRLDLTKSKAYTISPVSRNLYTEIPDQVRITYYISKKLSAIHPVPAQLEDLLREYAAYSHGRIRLTVRDPQKAGLSREVESLGIIPQQIEVVEQDQANIAQVYSGIVIEYLDQTDVIPFAFNAGTLEYDLTSRIRNLIRGTQREAAFLVGDTGKQWSTDYSILNQAFAQSGFRIRMINPGEEIPDTLPSLFVLGGVEDLDDWALYRLDRYIQGGGKVLFALDGVFIDANGGLQGRLMIDRGLQAMVSFYGATVKSELALDVSALSLSYQSVDANGSRVIRIVRYPLWIGVLAQNGNSGHPVTSAFGGIDVYWASPLELNPPESVTAVPLFYTTPEAWSLTKDFSTNPEMSYQFQAEINETKGEKLLGAALSGKFPSWFAGVPKPVREGSEEELPDMPAESKESRIIVIGDTDLVSTITQYTRSDRNFDFFLTAADWLGNDDDIISIRSHQSQTGRLDRITDDEKRLKAMAFARYLNIILIPLLVIALGVLRSLQRRRSLQRQGKESSDGV